MSIGQRIKERRKALKMSADELAKRLGKDRSTIYRYEKGEIENLPLDILEPIANALRTTPQYLMGWEAKNQETTNIKSKEDMTIGDVIKSLRIEKHLSLVECSEELGIPLEDLQQYENGSKQLSAKTINTIAHFFGLESVDIAEILLYEIGQNPASQQFRNMHITRAKDWYTEFGLGSFTDEETDMLFHYGRFLIWSRENKNT